MAFSKESMRKSSNAAGAKRVQYAALPYRLSGRSRTEVMLVTSRETQRWIIPKGWPQRGRAPYDSAAREAFEEAGVVGAVGRRSVGSFPYEKRLKGGGVMVCEVHVFPLKVTRQSKQWPEKEQRDVKWLSIKQAAETVHEPLLSKISEHLCPLGAVRLFGQLRTTQRVLTTFFRIARHSADPLRRYSSILKAWSLR